MSSFKIVYRVFGSKATKVNGQWGNHVDPASFVDVTLYTNPRGDELVKQDGGVDMKALKGHIRKEIGDTFYQFVSITKVGEVL